MKPVGKLLYVFGLWLYKTTLTLVSPFHAKAAKMIAGRRIAFKAIHAFAEKDKREKIWFHCASLGEFEQVRPLIERYKTERPELAILLTFFSPSGYEVRKNYALADCVTYLPFDSAKNAKRLINEVKPIQVFFAKYDLWYFYLREVHNQKIKTYLIAANFRKDQLYFKTYGKFFHQILHYFTCIFSQFDASTELLHQHGISTALTSGDTRYDRVAAIAGNSEPIPVLEQFKEQKTVGLLGSSYTNEETIALEVARQFRGKVKWIIAPHQVTDERIHQIQNAFKEFKTVRFSETDEGESATAEILILDTIGHLGNAYQYADFAMVGGGFGNQGIHNMLEPLAQGAPVWVGPKNHEKFPETKLALQYGVAQILNDAEELTNWIEKVVLNEQERAGLKSNCFAFIHKREGATEAIWKQINTV
jgi:3-deoxy-D-manno-octulosonic-acid transferase